LNTTTSTLQTSKKVSVSSFKPKREKKRRSKKTDRQVSRQRDRETRERETERQSDRKTERQSDRKTKRKRDKKKQRKVERDRKSNYYLIDDNNINFANIQIGFSSFIFIHIQLLTNH
jgi:hypothetical protein